MKIELDVKIPFPRPVAFAAYRDHIVDLLPYLPNVRGIEPQSRTGSGPVVEMTNIWHGGGEIPAAARAVLSESMLSWTDHARWDEGRYVCEWRIETHAFTDAVSCSGTHAFLEDGEGTLLQTRGEMRIDATKIRGVPRMFAGTVGKVATDVLVSKIRPNLAEVGKGLAEYLRMR